MDERLFSGISLVFDSSNVLFNGFAFGVASVVLWLFNGFALCKDGNLDNSEDLLSSAFNSIFCSTSDFFLIIKKLFQNIKIKKYILFYKLIMNNQNFNFFKFKYL